MPEESRPIRRTVRVFFWWNFGREKEGIVVMFGVGVVVEEGYEGRFINLNWETAGSLGVEIQLIFVDGCVNR